MSAQARTMVANGNCPVDGLILQMLFYRDGAWNSCRCGRRYRIEGDKVREVMPIPPEFFGVEVTAGKGGMRIHHSTREQTVLPKEGSSIVLPLTARFLETWW